MKKYSVWLIITLITILYFGGCKNNNIEINGKLINSVPDSYIFLDELQSTELIPADSAIISDEGSFSFNIKLKYPAFYLLRTDQSNFLTMLLEPGQTIDLNAYYDTLQYPVYLSGSEGTSSMMEYNKILRNTINRLSGLRTIYMQNLGSPGLAAVMENLDSLAQVYLDDINEYTKKYIDENITSLVSLVALYQQVAPGEYILHPEKDLKYFLKVDSSLHSLYPDYEPVKALHEQVRELRANTEIQDLFSPLSEPGTQAPEIALPDPKGDTIRLSSTRGKIVLLDFWASWCPPCRQENPTLIKAYELYNKKGFEIYQVSLDKTKEAWLRGIQNDNTGKWIHVSDLKYWSSVVVPLYRLESIPANFLLDKEGCIIASNLRGDILMEKLAEIFED
ncbi:MAG TPA: TlpA disulfide reductase family protein [Bacteroidales bacterium]|nr:TlpA disulfide reductase family protein [Bacteroidales bacterium]